jgi:hypothetical protein
MTTFEMILAWYIIGVISAIITSRIWGKITLDDLLTSFGVGVIGLFMTLLLIGVCITEAANKLSPWWKSVKDKELF